MPTSRLYITSLKNLLFASLERRGSTARDCELSWLILFDLLKKVPLAELTVANRVKALHELQLPPGSTAGYIAKPAEWLLAARRVEQFFHDFSLAENEVLLQGYLLALKARGCSRSTIKNYLSDIRQLLTFATDATITDVLTETRLLDFSRGQERVGLASSTIRRKLTTAAQFAKWLADEHGIESAVAVALGNLALNYGLEGGVRAGSAKQTLSVIPDSIIDSPSANQGTTGKPITEEKSIDSISTPINYRPASLVGVTHSKSAPTTLPDSSVPLAVTADTHQRSVAATPQSGPTRAQVAQGAKSRRSRFPKVTAQTALTSLALIISALGFGLFARSQFLTDPNTSFAYPANLTRPARTLSFQGRLTDSGQNPVTSATNMTFRLMDSGPSTSGGSELWSGINCSVDPDQDGIFSVGLGDECGAEIDADVFSENANVWLQVEVGAEVLSPRQSIKSVAYALNSETLQGYPASASATESTVVVMNSAGQIVLGNSSPVIKATSTNGLSIEGRSLNLITTTGSNGNITLDPDGIGQILAKSNLQVDGAATVGGILRTQKSLQVDQYATVGASLSVGYNTAPAGPGNAVFSGNVGIGTTNPGALFHIEKSSAGAGIGAFIHNSAASTLGNSAELGFGTWTNEYGGAPGGKISLINTNAGSGANAFTFFTKNTSGVVAERVRFDSQGNVGIGTTNPGAKLDIGTAGSSLGTLRLAGNTSGYVQIQPSAAAGSWTLTLPTGAGTNNFVLATNGSGVTSWVDPAALAAGTIYWTQTLGTIQPKNTTVDLLVGGTATSSAKAAFLNINSGTPTASVSAGTAGGAFLTATGNLSTTARQNLTLGNSTAFNTTGNILLNPNGTGNVGVGTTNPGYVLDVQATTGAMNLGSTTGTNYSYLTINNTGGYFRLGRENSAGGGLLAGSSPYASVLATQGTYPLQFGVNNALAMTILNGGNVGIGTTTPGSYKLNVNGKIYAATQGTAVGEVLTAGRTINTTGPLSGGGALTGDLTLSCPTCVTSSSFTGFANPSATIGLTAVNGSATTAMRSDAAPALSQAIVPTWTGTHTFSNATYSALFTGGNVGIGVTNPSTLLNIAGGLTTTGAVMTLSTNEPTVVANDVLGSINFNAPLQTGGGDGILTGASIAAVATGTFSTTVNSTALQFRTGNSEAATTKMTIAANGNVGIGTTSPDFALQVNGVIAPETTDQDLGTTSLRWDLLANTINADSTVTLTGLGTGTDNTVVILNSSNQLTTDEIDAKVWGTGLVDTASGTTNYVTKWTSGGETIGNSIIFDNGTNVGIGTASPVSKLDITTNSLGVAQTNASGVVLANTTAAAAGAQQISPAVRFRGQGWKTNATAGSQPVDFRMFVLPVQGTANPSGSFILQSDINASGTYTNRFVVGSNGTVTIPAMTTAGIVMNDASGNLSGGNTISSSNITTGSLVQGTGMSLSGTLTNRLVDSGSVTVGLAGQALALHNLATNGIIVRTGAGTVAARTITGTANQVIVTNGSGVSGDPTLSLPQNIHTSATPQFARLGLGAAANGTYHLNLNGALLHGTSTGLGIGTTSPGARLDVTNAGSNTFALIVGSDLGAETRTNATRKFVRVGMPHYTNAEEPVSLITGDSDGTNNIVTVGGGTGIGNASTSIQFNTAANASTVTGTTRMTIASNGAVNIANLSASLPVKTDASKNLISGAINLASSTEVTGTLPINRGGTNTTATPTAGGITYGTGTAYAFTSAGTAGQALLSGGAGAPTFGTLGLTYGGTNANLSGVATGGLIYKAASALAGTGALTGVLKGNGSSAPTAMTGITNYVTRWTDANTLGTGVLFDNGTNVGVGTATPTALFDVASGGSSLFKVSPAQIESAVPHLFSAAGDVSMAYDLIFTNQTAAGIESYGPFTIKAGEAFESNNLTLKTYNSGKLIIDSSNIWADGTNVGIGTTTPGAKLEVAGQVKITGGAPGVNKVLTSDATGLASWTDLSGIGVTSVTGTANQITASPTTGAVVLTLPSDLRAPGTFNAVTSIATGAGAGTVRIDASGNLTNIGTIAATGAVTIGGTEVISTGRLIKAANGAVGTPAFSFSADTNTGMYSGGTDILRLATAGTDRLTILANGNVGIGTIAPEQQLEIAKTGTDTEGPMLTLRQTSTGINSTTDRIIGEINFAGNDRLAGENGIGARIGAYASTTWNATTNDNPTDLIFYTNPDGSGTLTERLKIASNGTVSISGTFDPNGAITLPTTGISGAGSGSGLDADLLDGWNLTTASTVSTVVGRDASGDINARLFRSEYDTTNATIGYIMTQIDTVSNNYIRPSTPAQLVTGLGLEAGGSRDIWVEKAGDTMTGTLILPAATTSLSPLRIPHGTAHSSPTNGDIWTTTAGLYARINGATVGPYSATTGTVTSVGLSMPSIFTVTNSPVTTSGTLTATLANQNANIVFAGPTTGAATTPTFRSLVDNDIPDTITLSNITQITTRPHSSLTGLTSGDDHTQYALLAGRSGGQTLIGGTATTDDLILRTTSGVGATGADMIFQVGNNGATEAMRILNNGNVGIGTVSPGAKLALATHTTATGGILFGTDTNLYRSAANTLRTDDNLSVGTLATGATNTVITHSSGVLQTRTADAKIWGTGLVDTASGTTNYVTKWTSGGETIGNSIIFDNGTNVGIGTATPVSKLDVTTTALGVTQTNASGLLLANTTAAAAGAQQISPAVRWSGRGWKTAATAASQSVDFRSYVVPVQGTANPTGYLTFESSINGGAYVSGLNLASNGNVGIGTTAPTSKLEVTGNIVRSGSSNIFSSTTDYDNVKAQVVSLAHNTAITAGTYEYIGTDVIVTKSGADSSTGTLDVFGVKSAVQYLPSDNAFGATRRTYGGQFLAAGNTLGTSTAFGIVAKAELADLNYGVYASGSTYGVYSNGKFHFNTSGGGYGNYVCSSSSGTGTLGSCSSSIRYKENVADMDLGLNVVLAMDPKTFSWKYNGQSDYGFIAEDLERINPQLVFYNEEGQVEGVKYDRLTGVLANAMQEQQAQIEGIATSLSGQDVTFDDGGSLLIADSNGSYSVTSSGSTLSTIIAGAEVIGGTVRAGLVSAREISVSGVSQLGSLAVSGATQLSTLTVSGLTQLSSLTVSGFTQLANLTVTGSTNLASLTATGASTLASVSASSLSLTTDSLSIAGQSLRGYIESVVNQMQLNNAIALPEGSVIDELAVNSLSTEELATADLSASGAATINTADITNLSVAENATIAGKLEVASDATINGELNTNTLLTELLQADTTLLGSLLTETATVLGDATVSGSLAVSGDITSSGSARLQALESKLAEFEKIQATTAELFTASVSGTLYANHIADLDRLMAESVAPTFLQQLIGYDPLATDSARVISQITGVDLSETLVLDPIGLGELATESVLIGADAGFFKQYLQVNGNSALGGDVTIAGDLRMNQGLTISSNEIAYAPVLPESCTPVEGVITDPLVADSCRQLHTLKIQSSGAGALDLMNGLVVLADGTVTITGNVTFTQNITVQDTLLTDLISPTSFDKPIQLQVAGVSTESGEVQQSRFEIVNELGTPVATISAQGNADFAGKASFGEGVAIASQDLTTQVATIAGQLSSTKTSGKAKVVAGTSQIIITNSNVTEDSLIYVTPVGSTGNQTLYVKQQTGDDPLTAEVNEASFTVGTDFPLVSDATFNWWVVN